METLSKDLLEVLSVICHWSSYHGTHCRRTIKDNNSKTMVTLCPLHKELILDYKHINDEETLCQTSSEIKIVPRSYKHLRSVMKQLRYEDDEDQVDVITKETVGGLTEEADISDTEFIKLLSDDTCYYYVPPTTKDHKSKELKIILRKYCQNNAVVGARGGEYCEDCYKKLKNVPKISVVRLTSKET